MKRLFRKERLQEAHQFQRFKANQHLLLDWSVKQSSEMAEKGLPKTKAEAEQLIVEHQHRKVSPQPCTRSHRQVCAEQVRRKLDFVLFRRRWTPARSASTLSVSLAEV